jgi:hypothetical protein
MRQVAFHALRAECEAGCAILRREVVKTIFFESQRRAECGSRGLPLSPSCCAGPQCLPPSSRSSSSGGRESPQFNRFAKLELQDGRPNRVINTANTIRVAHVKNAKKEPLRGALPGLIRNSSCSPPDTGRSRNIPLLVTRIVRGSPSSPPGFGRQGRRVKPQTILKIGDALFFSSNHAFRNLDFTNPDQIVVGFSGQS